MSSTELLEKIEKGIAMPSSAPPGSVQTYFAVLYLELINIKATEVSILELINDARAKYESHE